MTPFRSALFFLALPFLAPVARAQDQERLSEMKIRLSSALGWVQTGLTKPSSTLLKKGISGLSEIGNTYLIQGKVFGLPNILRLWWDPRGNRIACVTERMQRLLFHGATFAQTLSEPFPTMPPDTAWILSPDRRWIAWTATAWTATNNELYLTSQQDGTSGLTLTENRTDFFCRRPLAFTSDNSRLVSDDWNLSGNWVLVWDPGSKRQVGQIFLKRAGVVGEKARVLFFPTTSASS